MAASVGGAFPDSHMSNSITHKHFRDGLSATWPRTRTHICFGHEVIGESGGAAAFVCSRMNSDRKSKSISQSSPLNYVGVGQRPHFPAIILSLRPDLLYGGSPHQSRTRSDARPDVAPGAVETLVKKCTPSLTQCNIQTDLSLSP